MWQNCHFRHICEIRRVHQLLFAPFTALCFRHWRLWQNCHFHHICQIRRFSHLLWAPFTVLCFPRWRLWQNCHFRHIYQIGCSRQLLWASFTALCFASLAIVAKLSFLPYLPNSPLSPTFMGPLHCFVLCLVGDCAKLSFSPYLPNSPLSPTFMGPLHYFVFFLVGDFGKIVIFAIFAKFATLANFYEPPSLLCAFPRCRLWQNCHFCHICEIRRFHQLLFAPFTALCFPHRRLWQNCHFHRICQIRRFRQLKWAPFTALCFASLAIVAKLSFSPNLPNSPLSPTFMGPLHCFVLCLVGDCGKIVIFAIFAKFAAFTNFYLPPSLLCVFLIGDCGKIVIFTIFAKFTAFANFYLPPSLLCVFPRWRLWQNCDFRHICQIRRSRQLLWAPFTALCFSSLAIVAKLSFSPYLPNSPLSPTFMSPLHYFVFFLVGDCRKIVIFAIFAKVAALANFYGPPSLLCVFPRWRLWQNCHFRHICQIHRFRQLLFAPFTTLCFSSLAIVAKLSFSPYLPNSPLSPTSIYPLHCFVFSSLAIVAKLSFLPYLPNSPLSPTFICPLHYFVFFLVGDCGKIVIFAIFAKFAALANFYGPPSLLCVFPRWRLWQNCDFRHICQSRRFRQLLWAPFTTLCFSSLAIVAKLSFSPYLPNSPLSPTFICPLHYFVFFLVGDCGKIVIFAIIAKFAAFTNFYLPPSLLCVFLIGDCGKIVIFTIFAKFTAFANFYLPPSLLCVFPRWRLWQNCDFRHICQIRRSRQLLWAPFTALCFSSLAIVAKLSFSPYLPNSPLSPTFMGPLHYFVFFLVGDFGKIVIFAIFAKFANIFSFLPFLLLCAFLDISPRVSVKVVERMCCSIL